MKVYRPKKDSVWVDPKFHLVQKHKWMEGTEWHHAMMVMRVFTWCRKNLTVEHKGGKFVDYDKVIHKGQLCDECVKMIKLWKQMNAPSQAQNLPQASQARLVPTSNGASINTVDAHVPAQEPLALTKGA